MFHARRTIAALLPALIGLGHLAALLAGVPVRSSFPGKAQALSSGAYGSGASMLNDESYSLVYDRGFGFPITIHAWRVGDSAWEEIKDSRIHRSTVVRRHISHCQWQELDRRIEMADFWSMPYDDGRQGMDGFTFEITAARDGCVRTVRRWAPDAGTPFEAIGAYLFELDRDH